MNESPNPKLPSLDSLNPSAQYPHRERRLDWLSIAFLAVLTVVFLWRVVFMGQILLPLDTLYMSEPWKSEASELASKPVWNPLLTDSIWSSYPTAVVAKEAHSQGNYFWDPYVLAGTPAMARGDLYSNPVFNLLALVMPVGQAVSWMAVFHLFAGGLFMFLFLRELGAKQFGALVAGLAFGFNGYLVGWLAIPSLTGTMIWLPLVFWGVERAMRRQDWRWALGGALGFALQIFSGVLLWPFYGAVTLGLYLLARSGAIFLEERKLLPALRPLLYGGLALGIGALLAAPQLLPTIQLFPLTPRTEALGIHSFLDLLDHLPRLLLPGLHGSSLYGATYRGPFNYVETTLYFGILPLAFLVASLFSRRRAPALALGGIGLLTLLAVYNVFPFKQAVNLIYPIFLNTFPGRIFYVTAFAWAAAAGLGADWLTHRRPPRLLGILSLGAMALGMATQVLFWLVTYHKLVKEQAATLPWAQTFVKKLALLEPDSILIPSIWLTLCAVLLWLWGRGKLKPAAFQFLALSILVADLFLVGINYNSAFDVEMAFPETPSIQYLTGLKAGETQPYRVLNINAGLLLSGMTPEIYGIPVVGGYSSWLLERYVAYADLTQSRGRASPNQIFYTDCCSPLLNALNVKYVYVSPRIEPAALGAFDLITRFDQSTVTKEQALRSAFGSWVFDGENRRVMILPPPARISYVLRVEAGAVFRSALALEVSAWDEPGRSMTYEVYVQPASTDVEELVFRAVVEPDNIPRKLRWQPVEIDLSAYAGQEIVLTLATQPGPDEKDKYRWSAWGEPQVANFVSPTLELIYDGPNRVYLNQAALPRAWIVHRITQVRVGDLEAAGQRLAAYDFDPAVEAVVEAAEPLPVTEFTAEQPSSAWVNSYGPNQVVIGASLSEPGLLVLSDAMYPGWEVRVDGIKQPILYTNLFMRGVALEAGEHEVVFVYRPVAFLTGLAASAGTLLTALVGLAWTWRRRRAAYEAVLPA